MSTPLPDDYRPWLSIIKGHIQKAQQQAALTVNRGMLLLYWRIGKEILERQQQQGWGAKIVDQLARDF